MGAGRRVAEARRDRLWSSLSDATSSGEVGCEGVWPLRGEGWNL